MTGTIIEDAIDKKGRTDEVDLYHNAGNYEQIMNKNKKGQPCLECGIIIEKLNVSGSVSYVCNRCQK